MEQFSSQGYRIDDSQVRYYTSAFGMLDQLEELNTRYKHEELQSTTQQFKKQVPKFPNHIYKKRVSI